MFLRLAANSLLKDRPWGRIIALAILFICSINILGLGSSEHTGVTGKDEYYLSLRVPLCMQEQQVWLVPCLDGEPRLRKPPMLYWLTKASFEIFGTSLHTARSVAVGFGSLLILAIALLALELGHDLGTALRAGFIALSCLGLAVGGRMLELDVPVATWSAWALVFLLRWYQQKLPLFVVISAFCLAAGFLTKGPVVLIVCGAGALALFITNTPARLFLWKHPLEILGIMLLTTVLTAPWFLYVYVNYPHTSTAILASELEARHLHYLSLVPIYGFLLIALPWSFIVIWRIILVNYTAINHNVDTNEKRLRTYALWLGFTLLPFFFIHSFERYLIGSVVPLALFLALPLDMSQKYWRWMAWLGLGFTLPAALTLQVIAVLLAGLAPWLIVTIPAMIWFTYQWWQAKSSGRMALSAALLWSCTLGLVYPCLGINKVPLALLEQVRGKEVVFYNGPQPGLLPILLGRSLVHVDDRWLLPERLHKNCTNFLLLSEEYQAANALLGLKQLGLQVTERGHFGILSAKVTWSNMFRPGMTWSGFIAAVKNGELERMKPQVYLYNVHNKQCQNHFLVIDW